MIWAPCMMARCSPRWRRAGRGIALSEPLRQRADVIALFGDADARVALALVERRILEVVVVVPADQGEALRRVEQAVDRRVAQVPGARRLQRNARRGAVQAVHHAAVCDERDGLAEMRLRQRSGSGHGARVETEQRFAALGAELGIA